MIGMPRLPKKSSVSFAIGAEETHSMRAASSPRRARTFEKTSLFASA